MSLLLKRWRIILKAGPMSKSPFRAQGITTQEVAVVKPADTVMENIKAAQDAGLLLATVQQNLGSMTHKHMMQALRSLFELQKASKTPEDSDILIKDPGFNTLCQNFKKHARALDVNEAIEATKVLSYLKVPVDSLIVQTMLQMIRSNINFINIRQIIFLDFILQRFDTKNHLVDALKLALPLAFQVHLPMELDRQDMPLLRDMLSYCCYHDLPDRCINNVITGLLLHDQDIDAETAKSIIWSLTEINCTQEVYPTRFQLLHICCDILCHCLDQLPYDKVLRTAARIKGRVTEKHPEYYHEQLMDSVANYVVKNKIEFEKSMLIARVLSRIAHTNLGLMQHLCQQALSDPTIIPNSRTNILFGFINCLSNSNYTPEPAQWEELRRQISLSPVLNTNNNSLPWIKVCLELASLGHFEDSILQRVFSDEFLEEHMARDKNVLDYIQLLNLYEAVMTLHDQKYMLPGEVLQKAKEVYPIHSTTVQLEEGLARGLGSPEYVVKNVTLPSGMVIDTMICLKEGYPVKVTRPSDDGKVPIEELTLPQHTLGVCVMNFNPGCFSMNSSRLRGTFRLIVDILEKKGYATVAINMGEWLNAPGHERIPYLMREVGYKCSEIGMRLRTA